MSPSQEQENRDNPKSPKLPPVSGRTEPGSFPKIPTAGVSPKLKVFVIGLTFLTIMAFGLFAAMMVKKTFIQKSDSEPWGSQWLTLAEELKHRGLKPQAVEHYQKYLDTQEVDLETRSRIALEISNLYVELRQCDDAMAWFIHAKAANPRNPGIQISQTLVQTCQKQSE